MNYVCTNYNERYDTIRQLIIQGKNIYLYGTGNNGKTFIVNQLLQTLGENDRDNIIVKYDSDPSEYVNNNALINKTVILEGNTPPNDQLINFVKVLFTGTYNNQTNSYDQ
jgi:hypothetical protein